VRLAHPPGFGPDGAVMARASALAAANGGRLVVGHDPRAAVEGADVIYTDAWTSMGMEARSRGAAPGLRRVPSSMRPSARSPDRGLESCIACPPIAARRSRPRSWTARAAWSSSQSENRLHVQKGLLVELLGDPAG
jgi:ornithine carbamoyltransferase